MLAKLAFELITPGLPTRVATVDLNWVKIQGMLTTTHPFLKMYLHTKFGNPTYGSIGDMARTRFICSKWGQRS